MPRSLALAVLGGLALACSRGKAPPARPESPPPTLSEPLGVDASRGDGTAGSTVVAPKRGNAAQEWGWAQERLPALADVTTEDPSVAALARFRGWADPEGVLDVWLRREGTCERVAGRVVDDGFVGRLPEAAEESKDSRSVSFFEITIGAHGIVRTGPHRERWSRAGESWHLASVETTAGLQVIAASDLARVTSDAAAFGGHAYRLVPYCAASSSLRQQCADGQVRTCDTCRAIDVQAELELAAGNTPPLAPAPPPELEDAPSPVDCNAPCPADPVATDLGRLAALLAERRFFAAGEGPTVYRTIAACERGLPRAPATEPKKKGRSPK